MMQPRFLEVTNYSKRPIASVKVFVVGVILFWRGLTTIMPQNLSCDCMGIDTFEKVRKVVYKPIKSFQDITYVLVQVLVIGNTHEPSLPDTGKAGNESGDTQGPCTDQ